MHLVTHLIVLAAAGAVFRLLTRPAELCGDRRWKTQLSHFLLICAVIGFGGRLADATMLEAIAMVGSLVSLLALGFLWAPNFTFLASRRVGNLVYGDGRGGSEVGADFRGAWGCLKDHEWAEAIRVVEGELAKAPNDFEGRRLLAEACEQLNLFDKAQRQMDAILNNPAATDDQKAWANSEQARIGGRKRTASSRDRRLSQFVSA
jgi:hypothetical protein